MKTLIKALLITFILIGSSSALTYGQGEDEPVIPPEFPKGDLRFQHLTTEDGLSEGRVWGITQDRRGFMWFTTWDGLNRYDGYEFKVYREEAGNPNSPGGTGFWGIHEDREGMIWVGSHTGGGLSRFDPTTEQWRRYQHDPDDPHSLSSNNVYAVFEDRMGVLWVGTEGGGLNRFEGETESGVTHFTRYPTNPGDPSGTSSDFIPSIYEDRSGELWFSTMGGLNRYDRETETFTHYRHDPEDPTSLSYNRVYTTYEDSFGVLWVGTWGGGLNRFDRETETFTLYKHDPDDPHSMSGETVISILEDSAGVLWIGTFGGGLNRYERDTDSFISYQHDSFDSHSLGSNSVSSLYEDQSGLLWIGTAGGGVDRLDPFGQGFEVIRHKPAESNSLSNNDIRCVIEDQVGDLWIGTWGGLNHYDPETETFTHHLHDPEDPSSLGDNHVWSCIQDRDGVLWLGLDTSGLAKLDRATSDGQPIRFTHFLHDPADPQSLSGNDIIVLYEDRSGILWVGTWAAGLNALDLSTEDGQARFKRYQNNPEDPSSLGSGAVVSILEDSTGALWVGTIGGGLCRFDRVSESFACYVNIPEDEHSLSNNTVWAIHQDGDGSLWVGTSSGLNHFDPQTGIFEHFTADDGLPHNTVVGILAEDASSGERQGHLWLSTLGGLSKFAPQAGTFQNYETSDGLAGNIFNSGAVHKTNEGRMLFGGQNGLTFFYPQAIQENPNIPPVRVTGFALSNEPVFLGDDSPLQQSIVETGQLDLSYEDRVISFEFAALVYASPEKNRYRFKLEGFDEEWTEVGSDRRYVTYTNLDPGDYTFKVLGSNNDGVWNEEGTSINITITPPWWGTWWFRGGILLLLVGLVAGGFVWQRESSRRRERHLKATVAERTHKLDARVKELVCLYGITRLARQEDASMEWILSGIVALIPRAWKYSDVACARITLNGQEFKTKDFRETPWQQSSAIVVALEQAGQVEVGYLEERPEADEGPFLKEERLLLGAVAERVGRIIEQRQAEQQLSFQSELLEHVGQSVIVTDLDGHVVYWNPSAERLYGWTAEEAMGEMTNELMVDHYDEQPIHEIRAHFLAGKVWSGEYLARRRDGTPLPVETTITPVINEAGDLTHVIGVSTDITERKLAEKALQTSEKEYRDLVEKISDVIYTVDTNGLITYLNPAVEVLIGLPLEELIGQSFAQFVHPEDLEKMQDNIQNLFSGMTPSPAEYRVLNASGETRWIRVSSQPIVEEGKVIGIQGALTDITERKVLEGQLEEAGASAERDRLARGLHDSVTQSLYSINLQSDAIEMALSAGNIDKAEGRLGILKEIAQEAMTEMRLLIYQLHPSIIQEVGLVGALRQRLDAVETRSGIVADFQVEGERRLPTEIENILFQVAQEGLNNVLKHANASEIQVRLSFEPDGCRLTILDNGVGFDPESTGRYGGYGLANMRERLDNINGELNIDSQPGEGTTLEIEVSL